MDASPDELHPIQGTVGVDLGDEEERPMQLELITRFNNLALSVNCYNRLRRSLPLPRLGRQRDWLAEARMKSYHKSEGAADEPGVPGDAPKPAGREPGAGPAVAARPLRLLRRNGPCQMRRLFRVHQAARVRLPPEPYCRADQDTQHDLCQLPARSGKARERRATSPHAHTVRISHHYMLQKSRNLMEPLPWN